MVLFFPFDLLSHYLRCMQLAETLKEEEVWFASSTRCKNLLEEKGFKTFDYKGLPTAHIMGAAEDFRFPWLKEDLLEEVFLEQVAILRRYQPRLVVGDATFTLRMATAYAKVPFVSVINAYMSEYYAYPRQLPPRHLIPRTFSFLPRSLYDAISVCAERIFLSWLHRPFRKLAEKYGIIPKHHLLQELQGDLTLLIDLPELFPQKKLPTHHVFIGPLYHTGHHTEPGILQWLQKGKKTLLVTTGSSGNPSHFLFLKEEAYCHFQIVVTGKGAQLLQAPHIFCQDFVHMESLLPHIDLMICHGGNGSIYQALQAGVPVLCHPSHFEQEWNVQALERKGWGARLKKPSQAMDQIASWSSLKNTDAWKRALSDFQIERTKQCFREKIQTFLI